MDVNQLEVGFVKVISIPCPRSAPMEKRGSMPAARAILTQLQSSVQEKKHNIT